MKRFVISFVMSSLFLSGTVAGQNLSEKGVYSYSPDEEHHFLLLLANRPKEFQEVRGEITKYIWKYFPGEHLKLTQIKVEGDLTDVPIVHLQSFDNQEKAMEFYYSLQKNKPNFIQMGITVDYFAISKSNYAKIILAKSLDGYKAFFEKVYLNKN